MELGIWAGTPPAADGAALPKPHAGIGQCTQPATARRVVADKENVLPCGTPQGSPQLPNLLGDAANSGGSKGGKAAAGEQPVRRPLGDVTHHYAAASKSICIGALGGGFGMEVGGPLAASCRQEAQAAAAANKARVAAVRRQALRGMR